MKYSSHTWTSVKGGGEQIVTGPDKLLALVAEMEEITLTDAANHLRVPKNVVGRWCDSLELEGVMRTEKTLKDIVLLSNEKHNFKNNYKKGFLRQIKAFNGNTKTWEMDMLLKKQQEINKQLRELESKTEKVRSFEKEKIENNRILRQIEKKEKNIESLKEDLVKHEEKLERLNLEINNRAAALSEKEYKLKKRSEDIVSITKEIQDREKNLVKEEKSIFDKRRQLKMELSLFNEKKSEIDRRLREVSIREEAINAWEKEHLKKFDMIRHHKRYLAEQNARLLERESKILEQVREMVVRTDMLCVKEKEVEKKYHELLQLRSTVMNTWGVNDPKLDITISA